MTTAKGRGFLSHNKPTFREKKRAISGTTKGNWGKFEKNLFKGISGIPDKNVDKLKKSENDGVLSSRAAS